MNRDIKNILICGNYGIDNLGDDAILGGLKKLILSVWPAAKITVMSSSPLKTSQNFKVKSVRLFPVGVRSFLKFWFTPSFFAAFKALKKADIVFLGGGGLFNDQEWKSILIWYVQFLWFRIFHKKLVCIAQSVGPLKHKRSRILVKSVFKYAKLVTVRDGQSLKLLHEIGIEKVHLLSDPAFAIGYESEKSVSRQDRVVLSVRPWKPANSNALYKEIAHAIDEIFMKHGLKFVFLPFQQRIENDELAFYEILSLLEHKEAIALEYPDDYIHALEIIGRSSLVLGMRLHSIIFSCLTITPFVALSYSQKVKSFADSIGMNNFVLDIDNIQANSIVHKIEQVLKSSERDRASLEKQKMQNTYRFFEHENLLKSTFESHN